MEGNLKCVTVTVKVTSEKNVHLFTYFTSKINNLIPNYKKKQLFVYSIKI
jgi:hypothetical protein